MKTFKALIIGLTIFSAISCASLSSQNKEYLGIIKGAGNETPDFVFMKINDYLRQYPDTLHTRDLRFAKGEYYLQVHDYNDAIYEFSTYIVDYPDDKNAIFAHALLYKIMLEEESDPELSQGLKEKFFSKSLFLVFSDAKVKSYKSILNNEYNFIDYVDKVKFYKNNELLFEITP